MIDKNKSNLYPENEHHYVHRIGWLRAAVLGANDGIVSTASLMVGVGAASSDKTALLLAGVAGLVAGAMSMAAGEYVSVSSQSDVEKADLETEKQALKDAPEFERRELAAIYERRGLDPDLASEVAEQLMAHDALSAHARDELGISEIVTAKPIQAALTSALTFSLGAALPLLAALFSPVAHLTWIVGGVSLVSLATLGVFSAGAGGAGKLRAAIRVVFWGAAAMAVTGLAGALFGAVV